MKVLPGVRCSDVRLRLAANKMSNNQHLWGPASSCGSHMFHTCFFRGPGASWGSVIRLRGLGCLPGARKMKAVGRMRTWARLRGMHCVLAGGKRVFFCVFGVFWRFQASLRYWLRCFVMCFCLVFVWCVSVFESFWIFGGAFARISLATHCCPHTHTHTHTFYFVPRRGRTSPSQGGLHGGSWPGPRGGEGRATGGLFVFVGRASSSTTGP